MKIDLLGGCSKEELEYRIKKVASAGKLSRYPGNVFEVLDSCDDYEKNLKLIKRIIKMGHKSIIEHDYLVFAICDVSPIIEQTIIGNRLTSFTIKSRREVDFRSVGYYIPEFRDTNHKVHNENEKIKKEYKKHMQDLFDFYGEMVDDGINVEDARFILPYCYHSNIIMGLNARELEKMVISFLYGRLSRISEVKELGEKLYDLIKKYVPYLVDNIESQVKNDENPFNILEDNVERPEIEILKEAKIISHTDNPDDVVLESHIMYHYQCTKEKAKEILKNMEQKDNTIKAKLMQEILNKSENRELEQVYFTIQIPISLSILTHLTRHRMHSLLVPEFVPMWNLNNFIIPNTIKEKGWEEKFKEKVKKNIEVFNKFKKMGIADEDLIYFYIGGQMCNVVTTMNARNIQWVCRLRCCNKAQWQIRNIANQIANQVKKIAPLIGKGIGPTCITNHICNEGRESCGLIDKILLNDSAKGENI